MPEPFFSVIITTYNRARLLKVALKSLDLQSFKDYEAFIIDDSSTDDTSEIIGTFNDRSNWHFIKLIENRGYPYCKNFAFKQCKGKFITFLDSDDIWLPDRLKKFFELIQKNPGAGFIFSNGYILSDEVITGKMFDGHENIPKGKMPGYMVVSNKYLPYVTTNVAFPKTAIDTVGYYNEDLKLLGDTEYFVRVVDKFSVDYIEEPLSIYRIHGATEAQITCRWDDCINESIIALNASPPSKEIYDKFIEYIYIQQSEAFIKNGYGQKARKYLKQMPLKGTVLILYIFSCVPRLIVKLLQKCYRKYRRGVSGFFITGENKNIIEFIKRMENY